MNKRINTILSIAVIATFVAAVFNFAPTAGASSTTTCSYDYFAQKVVCTTTPDPIQQQEQRRQAAQAKLDSLKAQYGASAYYSCYPAGGSLSSDPYYMESAYLQTKYCLENKQLQNGSGNTPVPQANNPITKSKCSDSNVLFHGTCQTIPQICKSLYGELSDAGTLGRIGKQLISEEGFAIDCRCVIGSAPNPNQTACVALAAQNAAPVQQQQNTGSSSPSAPQNASSTAPTTSQAAPQEDSTQASVQPTQEKAPENIKKPSLFRRILNFFKSLFKFRFGHNSK